MTFWEKLRWWWKTGRWPRSFHLTPKGREFAESLRRMGAWGFVRDKDGRLIPDPKNAPHQNTPED